MQRKFKVDDSNFIKGIAIILMIVHHLFWNKPGIGITLGNIAISQRIGILGKVCVTLFLILSGYGLYESTKNKEINLFKFYKKRIVKIYSNYIIVVLVSFAVGIIFFSEEINRLLKDMFIYKMFLSITGIQYLLGYPGFNTSWWFISVIIVYYLIFPYLKIIIDKYKYSGIVILLLTLFINVEVPIINIRSVIIWLPPFIIGIYCSKVNAFVKVDNYLKQNSSYKYIKYSILSLLFIALIYKRQYLGISALSMKFDFVIGLLIIIIGFSIIENINLFKKILIFVGKHSTNMYLIHMFISNYYTDNFIYRLNNPFIMTCVVVSLSLIISIIIEFIKKITSKKVNIYNKKVIA